MVPLQPISKSIPSNRFRRILLFIHAKRLFIYSYEAYLTIIQWGGVAKTLDQNVNRGEKNATCRRPHFPQQIQQSELELLILQWYRQISLVNLHSITYLHCRKQATWRCVRPFLEMAPWRYKNCNHAFAPQMLYPALKFSTSQWEVSIWTTKVHPSAYLHCRKQAKKAKTSIVFCGSASAAHEIRAIQNKSNRNCFHCIMQHLLTPSSIGWHGDPEYMWLNGKGPTASRGITAGSLAIMVTQFWQSSSWKKLVGLA